MELRIHRLFFGKRIGFRLINEALRYAEKYIDQGHLGAFLTEADYAFYGVPSARNTETNPLVGGKLGVSDCPQVTDGAAVIVFSSKKFMKEWGEGQTDNQRL